MPENRGLLEAGNVEQADVKSRDGLRFFVQMGVAGNIGLAVLAIFGVIAMFGPALLQDPNVSNTSAITAPPGTPGHLLGTDQLGRDMLARSVAALRVAFVVSAFTGIGAMVVGSALGMMSGFYRGKTEAVVMAFADIIFAFPTLLLALIILSALGGGLTNSIIALAVVWVPRFIRVVASATRSMASRYFVEASLLSKVPGPLILVRHVLPNVIGPTLVLLAISMASAQIAYASLSFLGLGLPLPQADFGSMLSRARTTMLSAPWLVIVPSLALTSFIVSLNLVSDGLRDVFDPEDMARDVA